MPHTVTPGRRLLLLRDALGIDAAELSRRAGVHTNTISNIETGKSQGRETTLEWLAKAMDVPAAALTDDRECVLAIARIAGVALEPGAVPSPAPVKAAAEDEKPITRRELQEALAELKRSFESRPTNKPGDLAKEPGTEGVGDTTSRGYSENQTEGETIGRPPARAPDSPGAKPRQP